VTLIAGVIEKMRLVIAPTIAGRGRRLLDGEDNLRRLELIALDRTPGGALLLHYRIDASDRS